MAIVNGYCTEADLQRVLTRTVTASDENYTLLQDTITRASRFIDEMTGTFWYQRTITSEEIDCFDMSDNRFYIDDSQSKLYCPSAIINISSIVEDGVTLTENVDYTVYKSSGVIIRNGYWSGEKKGVVVSGVFGFSSTPAHVARWCVSVAEVFSGLATRSFTDSDGNQLDIQKNNLPKSLIDDISAHRRFML